MEQTIKVKKKKHNVDTESVHQLVVSCMQDIKSKNIVSLDLRNITDAVTDYFVIGNADSTTQVRAIASHIEQEATAQLGVRKLRIEGKSNGEWVLIDFGDVVVHIFQTDKREFYQLEDLWSDAPRIEHLSES